MEFFNMKTVRAGRNHVCAQCCQTIGKGDDHNYVAMKFDGDFSAYREHPECREAWMKLNFEIRYLLHSDGASFLCDDEWDDREEIEWLKANYPIVYERVFCRTAALEDA